MDSDQPGFEKYLRWGYYSRSRKSDELLEAFLSLVPAEGYLPSRWKNAGDYAKEGVVLWAASASSHTLLIGGTKVLRIWTDATNHCWVEGWHHVLPDHCVPIPPNNARKSKPFSARVKITTPEEMYSLAKRVKTVYGI